MASIRKRTWASNGRERSAWVVDYVDAAGKRRLKTFAAKKAAGAWLLKVAAEVTAGTHTPDRGSLTVGEAGRRWLLRGEIERLEPATLRYYRIHLDCHIAPALGALRLSKLST